MKSFRRVYVLPIALVFASLALDDAHAQAKKGAKKAAPKADQKVAPAKGEQTKPGAKKEERQGPASFKDVPKLEDAEKEAIADRKRDEAIESLKKIIR